MNWRDKNQNKHRVLYANGSGGILFTGSTLETELVALPIPANTLEVGDILRVRVLAAYTTSAGTAALRMRFGNNANMATNSAIYAVSSTALTLAREIDIAITSPTTCSYFPLADNDAIGTSNTIMPETSSDFDITSDMTFYFSAKLGHVDAAVKLTSYTLELIKRN